MATKKDIIHILTREERIHNMEKWPDRLYVPISLIQFNKLLCSSTHTRKHKMNQREKVANIYMDTDTCIVGNTMY